MSYNGICERIKQVRIKMSGARGQCHFAAAFGLSPSTYNYYEKGRLPPVDFLDAVANKCCIPLEWLIRGDTDFNLEKHAVKLEEPAAV